MFQTKVIEENNTHFLFNKSFRNSCRLWDNVEKHCGDGRTVNRWGHNMAHELSMPDK